MSDKYGIRGVNRGPKPAPKTDLMPLAEAMQIARESAAKWMTRTVKEMNREHEARIKDLREGREHPNPLHARYVKKFSALRMPKYLISRLLEIPTDTLAKCYADECELGHAEAFAAVATNYFRIATSDTDPGARQAAADWLAKHGGKEWQPPAQRNIHIDENAEAPLIDSSKLTFEDRAALREMLTRLDEEGAALPPAQETQE